MKDKLLATLRQHAFGLAVLVCAFSIYFPYYGNPASMFWDENYHIASAQKHIDGVMYMEPHPPLGKMLMGLAENVLGHNDMRDMHKLDETDYLKGEDMPSGMQFKGFRWPSTVLMAIASLFFYGILARITEQRLFSALLTSLVIFDNALVIHSRSAMLEGIQLFFALGALYYFTRTVTGFIREKKAITWINYAILGLWIGLTVSVKVNGFVLLLLFVMLFGVDQWQNLIKQKWQPLLQRLLIAAPAGVAAVALVFFTVFYIHIGMGQKVLPGHTYKASPEYLLDIQQGKTWAPSTFFTGMHDNWKYMSEYADGVPKLDECKPDENGSFAMDWILGKKTISYRWDKDTVDGKVQVKYMYLVANPVVWLSVVAGLVLSLGLIMSKFVYGQTEKNTPLFYWICAFTFMYVSYMTAILQIERVMYLYHYLMPLIFGMINLGLVISYIFREELLSNNKHFWINLSIFVALVIGVFAFFSPFTYGFAITEDQFEMRNWFSFWKMQVVR